MKRLIVDLDDTISFNTTGNYSEAKPNEELVTKLRYYKNRLDFEIVISTSRNMRTFKGNVGKINKVTLPIAINWLTKHDIPFDEIYTGKPWCGFEGFYIDDKAIRPNEFIENSYEEILELIGK